ncbi:HNH endonuclease [Candidatus Pacearchaeota archaeon]|nr:HNH endonuclease [Candidatus Pacearchaeota archaeon]
MRKRPVKDRFLEKCGSVLPSGCIEWQGCKSDKGYGQLAVKGKSRGAHIVAYELFVGEIKKCLCVIHRCKNNACVNHEHLYLGSRGDYQRQDLKERLLRRQGEPTKDGCIEWQGCRNACGYGVVRVDRATMLAHRVTYEAFVKKIPSGLQVLHQCDNPACVNIKHLFIGTHQDNMNDKKKKGRDATGEAVGGSKLTPSDVRKIREMNSTGEYSLNKMGKKFSVSHKTIQKVVNGVTWKHVI